MKKRQFILLSLLITVNTLPSNVMSNSLYKNEFIGMLLYPFRQFLNSNRTTKIWIAAGTTAATIGGLLLFFNRRSNQSIPRVPTPSEIAKKESETQRIISTDLNELIAKINLFGQNKASIRKIKTKTNTKSLLDDFDKMILENQANLSSEIPALIQKIERSFSDNESLYADAVNKFLFNSSNTSAYSFISLQATFNTEKQKFKDLQDSIK